MADEESTDAVVEETPVAAEVEKESVDDDVELEDIEVSPEELESTDDEPEEADEEDDTKSESEEESTEAEAEDDKPEEPLSDEEKQKQFNNEMAQRRIQEKQQREATQKEKQQEYLDAADPDKPEDLALRQLQVDAYNNKVEGNTNKLTNGYEKAIGEFKILSSDDPVIKAEVDAAIDAFQAQYVTVDAYGNPTDVRGDFYQYLQSKADSIERLTSIGARQQEKSKSKEKSKAMTTPSRAPKEAKKDPDLDAFDAEAAKY